jgi:methyl-accepting chemotaxis protein
MKWYKNLKIPAKLVSAFLLVALIAGVVGVFGIVYVKKIQTLDMNMYTMHTSVFDDLANVLIDYQKTRVVFRDVFLSATDEDTASNLSKYEPIKQEIISALAEFEKCITTEAGQQKFDELDQALDEYFEYVNNDIIPLINAGRSDEAMTLMYSDGVAIASRVQAACEELMALKVKLSKESADQNQGTANTAVLVMIIVVCAGVAVSIILGIVISRLISKPIGKMVNASQLLAKGEVDVRLDIDTKDEIGALAASFKSLIEGIREQVDVTRRVSEGDLTATVRVRSDNDVLGLSLQELMDKLNQTMEIITSASEQVASGSFMLSNSSIALSQGATEQASSVEQLTASLEEISSQTIVNTENARKANDLAKDAETHAEKGNEQMNEMLAAMADINESSSSIGKIIKVIDDIAFQTNILALNAAVEAARAGQHGKGFAVVAEEVRNLAAKSANAAKETTDLIESSIRKVTAGTKIANNTADALELIVGQVKKAAELVANIAAASEEQSAAVEQINQGIMQVSNVVQNNAATSEESAAASEELSSQASQLKEIVGTFKIKQHKFRNDGRTEGTMLPRAERQVAGAIKTAVRKPQLSIGEGDLGKY